MKKKKKRFLLMNAKDSKEVLKFESGLDVTRDQASFLLFSTFHFSWQEIKS